MQEETNYKYILEAVLFASGDMVPAKTLAEAVDLPVKETEALLNALKDEYDFNMRGIKICKMEHMYQMISRDDYFPYISKVMRLYTSSSLSQAALETLAIIAYKQPVTRADIEYIRGVQSSSSLDLLIAKNLVRSSGRLDIPGRPNAYVTTEEFLKLMNIPSLEMLPDLERFKEELDRPENISFDDFKLEKK
jgi:segregation and condensation protein B